MVGFLFRNFYSGSSPSTLLKVYTCLVHPILEYCSVAWDTSSSFASSSLESVLFFALKVTFKSWYSSYDSLLSLSTLNSQLSLIAVSRQKFFLLSNTSLIFVTLSILFCTFTLPPLCLLGFVILTPLLSLLSHLEFLLSSIPSFSPLLDFRTLFLFLFVSLLLSHLLNSF